MAAPQRSNTPLILLLVLVVVGVIALVIYLNGDRYKWYESYAPDDDQPYGTLVFHRLMKEVRSNQEFVMLKDSTFKELPADPTDEVDNYLYIGDQYYGSLDDTKQLFDFVAAGNNAYIFCNNQYHLVADSILALSHEVRAKQAREAGEWIIPEEGYEEEETYDDYEDEYLEEEPWDEVDYFHTEEKKFYSIYDSTVMMKLKEGGSLPKYPLSKYFHFKKVGNDWTFFSDSLSTADGKLLSQLGYFNSEYPNYVMCDFGKGHFYLHSTPIIFTNYYMLNDTAMNYCRTALQSFGNGKVYWDEDNRNYDSVPYTGNPDEEEPPGKPQEGPMEFILSEPSLKYAWYLLLGGALLYVMFGAKRKQRTIPPAENMENTSVEYTEVISQMFMTQSDHKKLVKMKMDLFRAYLRDRFYLKLPTAMADENDELYKHIAARCNVKQQMIKDIFEQNKFMSSIVQVDTPEMMLFHNRLETFYESCK